MVKTKRCRNGKMKKHNKTQKYVKSGGFLSNIRGKKKHHNKFQYFKKTNSQILKMTPDNLIHNITSNLNVMKQEHNHILEHLDDLFYNLKNNYKYDKSKYGDDIKTWCNFYNKPLTQYKTMKEEINALQKENPSLVSLIQKIQKKIEDFETNYPEYKDDNCTSKRPNTYENIKSLRRSSSDGPLPPIPVARSSSSQAAAPHPPPRGLQKPGSGKFAKLDPNRMTRKISTRKPSTLKPLNTDSTYSPYQGTTDITHLLQKNSPYENEQPRRRYENVNLDYNPFFDPNLHP